MKSLAIYYPLYDSMGRVHSLLLLDVYLSTIISWYVTCNHSNISTKLRLHGCLFKIYGTFQPELCEAVTLINTSIYIWYHQVRMPGSTAIHNLLTSNYELRPAKTVLSSFHMAINGDNTDNKFDCVIIHSSSSCMCVISHNWSATKQRLYPHSVAKISCHSVLSGDRIRQCETSSGSHHKDTDQCP